MKFAIFGKTCSEENKKYIQALFAKFEAEKIEYLIYSEFYEVLKKLDLEISTNAIFSTHDDLKDDADFLISIGGDGTYLNTISLVRDSGIPIVGINTGTLGFLSNIPKDEIEFAIDEIIKGNYSLDKRALLKLETEENLFGDLNYALNELTIHKQDSSSMITTQVYLDDVFLNSYWSDGLIIATPTGSTAYSLSCGGPIITPGSGNFIITPVAPHNLNVRPIVISDDTTITVKVEGRNERFLISLDSRSETIDQSVKLKIRKHDFHVNLLRLNNQDFPSTLRNKLMWGLDKRN
ncbi:MAG: NAD kinase [Bacteroidetes bacterium]|nr:MAG: NAD kinase [Bacteroidota bacterium]